MAILLPLNSFAQETKKQKAIEFTIEHKTEIFMGLSVTLAFTENFFYQRNHGCKIRQADKRRSKRRIRRRNRRNRQRK